MSGHSVYRERLRVTLKKTPTSKDDDRSRNVMDLPKFVKNFFNSELQQSLGVKIQSHNLSTSVEVNCIYCLSILEVMVLSDVHSKTEAEGPRLVCSE